MARPNIQAEVERIIAGFRRGDLQLPDEIAQQQGGAGGRSDEIAKARQVAVAE